MDDLGNLQLPVIPAFDIGVEQGTTQGPQSISESQLSPILAQQQLFDNNKTTKKKRPMNSFLLFCKDKREEALMQNPHLKSVDISPILAEQWKNLPETEKQKYKLKAAEQQKQFKEENPDYQYERGKQRHLLSRQKGETKPKPVNVYDVKTLLSFSPDDIRAYLYLIGSQTGQNQPLLQDATQPYYDQQFLGHELSFHSG